MQLKHDVVWEELPIANLLKAAWEDLSVKQIAHVNDGVKRFVAAAVYSFGGVTILKDGLVELGFFLPQKTAIRNEESLSL